MLHQAQEQAQGGTLEGGVACEGQDLLVCLGSASISAWASALPERPNAGNHHKKPVDA
ncbi:MAG: hypothetical protein HYY95_22955 [Candidatus Rokubacteria bacterium]|nr:hypothetical protein [Candidatus Rokubacteria bacterium]